jgi:hypothetical protein
MNPALTTIQNDVRAADLRARAERQRTTRLSRRSSRTTAEEVRDAQRAAHAPAFGALFLGHGFFGREHGSAA